MGSPDEPKPPAGSAAAMAHRDMRKRYDTIGMHAPAGQARPARVGMTVREMVSLLLFPSWLCCTCGTTHVSCISCGQAEKMPTLPAPVPFWRARTARPTATPRDRTAGGKCSKAIGYMGWRPGETYDLSNVKHGERTINRPMTAGDHIPPLEERAAIRAVSTKPTGYHGHIPRRFDRHLTQPGGQGDVDQIYIHHRPGRVGHPDMPPITLEPQLVSPEHRTIERDPSTVVHRARTEVRHMFEETKRGSPRGARDGVGMGYSGHVPHLFGGLKTLPGAPPSLLNGPGLCEKPRVDVRPHCILGAEHSSYALALLTCLRLRTVREVDATRLAQRTSCAQRVEARPA